MKRHFIWDADVPEYAPVRLRAVSPPAKRIRNFLQHLEVGMDEKFFNDWKRARERDEALLEAARQQRERLLSLHQSVSEKVQVQVQVLLCSKAGGLDDQGLMADLDALEAALRGITEGPCSPSGT